MEEPTSTSQIWNASFHKSIQRLGRVILIHCAIIASNASSCIFTSRVKVQNKQRHASKKEWSRTKLVFATVCNIDQKVQSLSDKSVHFDTDTAFVVCDNSANTHICNDKELFTELQPIGDTCHVATIGGKNSKPSGIGTVKWSWLDDTGVKHEYTLSNVYFFPGSPVNILSVTEFVKQLKDSQGTGIDTKASHSRFYWENNKFSCTFDHSTSNLPELPINPGTGAFAWFLKKFNRQCDDTIDHFCCLTCDHVYSLSDEAQKDENPEFLTSVIYPEEKMIFKKEGINSLVKVISSELKEDRMFFNIQFSDGTEVQTTREFLNRPQQPEIANIPVSTDQYKKTASTLSDEDLEKLAHPQTLSPHEQEFLDTHHRLFHLPYSMMFWLAKIGFLPKYFSRLKQRPPPCASCLFGMAHRKPWRFKTTKDGKKSVLKGPGVTEPGQCVGVDQMVSAQPGLVAQEKGSLTRGRIWGCTVFVDYATSLVSVMLQRDLGTESTLASKREFEQRSAQKGVKIEHYHADNGRFAEPTWKEDCTLKGQKLTYCGVGAHHQNAMVERKIKDLTLTGRTLLLHAIRHWPEYMSQILWPFAVKCAEDRLNNLQIDLQGLTAEMKFAKSLTASVDLRNFHTFGCPCYIPDARVQTDPKGLPKWEPRSRLGIYLGHSPSHAGSVALVMNPKSGLVLPQFHVVFDDFFHGSASAIWVSSP